jgi:hypothetical protein
MRISAEPLTSFGRLFHREKKGMPLEEFQARKEPPLGSIIPLTDFFTDPAVQSCFPVMVRLH